MCLARNGKVFTASFLVQATVAYYLVLDNRRRMSTGYQGAEFDAVKVSCQGHTAHSIMLYEYLRVSVRAGLCECLDPH
jgi:hypothetical protein